jgi:hypothetical protein
MKALKLLDAFAHLLRHSGFHSIKDLVEVASHLGDVVALVALVEDGLQLLGGPQAGVDTDLRVVVHQAAERLVHHDLEEGERRERGGYPLNEVAPFCSARRSKISR